MNLLHLLKISTEDQKGYNNFREYLRLNKAIHYFVYCLNKRLDDLNGINNDPAFKTSRLLATLVFLKNCIEAQDIAELTSVEKYCDDILAISSFPKFELLLNYVMKREVYYIDESLTNDIENIIQEFVKNRVVGSHFNSEKNEFSFDDVSCNTSESQYLFDKINWVYRSFKEYNFGIEII